MPESIWKRFRLKRKEVLYSVSDKAHRVYRVDKGAVMERYPSLSGNCFALLHGRGEIFGEGCLYIPKRRSETKAIVDSAIMVTDKAELMHYFEQNPEDKLAFHGYLAFQAQKAYYMIAERSYSGRSVYPFIAMVMKHMAKKIGIRTRKGIILPVSSADLAELSGTTWRTVNRFRQKFVRKGVLAPGTEEFRIVGWKRLSGYEDIPEYRIERQPDKSGLNHLPSQLFPDDY
ncbi:MAG: Crp/Fnr family transcriptional regulator [Candidatus Aenigmarchaeota archaeon]|nr:Crp/Fnr family transcriptional regulator [Candidatus Aenigmarchaeota archaeon]